MAQFWTPDESSGEIITVLQLEALPVRDAVGRRHTRNGPRPYRETSEEAMVLRSGSRPGAPGGLRV